MLRRIARKLRQSLLRVLANHPRIVVAMFGPRFLPPTAGAFLLNFALPRLNGDELAERLMAGASEAQRNVLSHVMLERLGPSGLIDALIAGSKSEAQRADLFDAIVERLLPSNHQTLFWGDRMLTLDKAAGFLDDPAFRDSFEAIRGAHIYDAYRSSQTIAWRLHTLVWAARCGLSHDGDFVECGVFKGDMAWVVATVLGVALRERRYFLYDSFEGLAPASAPTQDADHEQFVAFSNNVYREPGIYESVVARFAGMPNVRIIRGFLPNSLALEMPDRIAFLHVDLNAAEAEIGVLERLFDRVVTGGVIVFDDYGWARFHRQREAEDRFMAARGHTILELPTGQGLVIKQETKTY